MGHLRSPLPAVQARPADRGNTINWIDLSGGSTLINCFRLIWMRPSNLLANNTVVRVYATFYLEQLGSWTRKQVSSSLSETSHMRVSVDAMGLGKCTRELRGRRHEVLPTIKMVQSVIMTKKVYRRYGPRLDFFAPFEPTGVALPKVKKSHLMDDQNQRTFLTNKTTYTWRKVHQCRLTRDWRNKKLFSACTISNVWTVTRSKFNQ